MEVKFDTSTVDNLQGLHCYMNTLVSNNDDLQRFQIRKVSYYWGYNENNFVYYMFAPPWIRLIVVSALRARPSPRVLSHQPERRS